MAMGRGVYVFLSYSKLKGLVPNNKQPRLTVADGSPTLCGVIITSKKNGLAESIKPIRIGGVIDNVGI